MSNYYLTLAFFMPEISSSRKFVLVALADAANDFGLCYPSIAHIIDKTSLDRKTIIDCIADLKKDGFLIDTGERKGKTKQIPVFRLALDKSPKNGIVQNRTVPKTDGNSPVFTPKQSQKRDTEPLEPSINLKGLFERLKKEGLANDKLQFFTNTSLSDDGNTLYVKTEFMRGRIENFFTTTLENVGIKNIEITQ